jgi:PAS domain S-box-containing protein
MAGLIGLFNDAGMPPHGFCLLWNPALIRLHVFSDALIGLSYYSIPAALAYFVLTQKSFAYNWIIRLFGLFILSCGTTHFMEIWVLWHPDYTAQGLVKAFTALVSAGTAVALWPLVTRLKTYPTPAQFRDVSDRLASETARRQRALASLHRSEQSLRALLEGVVDHAIFMLDPSGYVTSWSAGARRIKGYSEYEILGRHFSTFYTPEDRAAGLAEKALAVAAQAGKFETEGWRVRKDGSRFWAHVVMESLRNESGELIGYAKITRDFTEQHQATLALEQARAALAQAQKMETVGHLTGGIAHDFNNLLTAIIGGADLLTRRLAGIDDMSRRVLQGIIEAGQRGAALVERLLAFSRKQTLSPQVVDVNRLIAEMLDLLRRALGEQVRIGTVLAGGIWRVHVDRNQLENAILNLAVNARDAMPEGGRLTLETGNTVLDDDYAAISPEVAAGEYVMIAVSDTGTGMPPEVRERAFEPFFTTKPEGRGTGLGLSQVYGFIRQSGGDVRIESEPGAGTTVKIFLPRHAGAEAGDASHGLRHMPAPVGSETILLVEDHADVRAYATSTLGHLGYRVLEARDANDGLAVLAAHPEVSLLFTDVGLPGMNGRQLAEQARRMRPGLKVLFATGYARDALAHRGILDADVHLLPKPYTVEALARKLRAVLDGTPGPEGTIDKAAAPG